MAIDVICPGCHKRFQVNEKFAGRKGPCPSCKTEITIPAASDQVVVHAPESSGPKDSKGKLVLKPIKRREAKISTLVGVLIGVGSLLVVGLAAIVGFTLEEGQSPPVALLVLGALALGPPLAVAAYTFLQDDELEPYQGGALWLRAGICGAIYALLWGLYGWGPLWILGEDDLEIYLRLIFVAALAGIGGFTALACFDLEFLGGLAHFGTYLVATAVLAWLAGIHLVQLFPV